MLEWAFISPSQVCGYTPILGLVIYDCLPDYAVPEFWRRPLMGPGAFYTLPFDAPDSKIFQTISCSKILHFTFLVFLYIYALVPTTWMKAEHKTSADPAVWIRNNIKFQLTHRDETKHKTSADPSGLEIT